MGALRPPRLRRFAFRNLFLGPSHCTAVFQQKFFSKKGMVAAGLEPGFLPPISDISPRLGQNLKGGKRLRQTLEIATLSQG